jgi:hypothetical protein
MQQVNDAASYPLTRWKRLAVSEAFMALTRTCDHAGLPPRRLSLCHQYVRGSPGTLSEVPDNENLLTSDHFSYPAAAIVTLPNYSLTRFYGDTAWIHLRFVPDQ